MCDEVDCDCEGGEWSIGGVRSWVLKKGRRWGERWGPGVLALESGSPGSQTDPRTPEPFPWRGGKRGGKGDLGENAARAPVNAVDARGGFRNGDERH